MSRFRSHLKVVCVLTAVVIVQIASAKAQDGGDRSIPIEIRGLLKQQDTKADAFASAKLTLQMRTAYAIGGVQDCETVISISNFSKGTVRVEVEFFTGFNFFQRGMARLTLRPGETGEVATAGGVPPFVINAIRDSSVLFEGYANIHAETTDIAAHCHMVYNKGDNRSYQSIKVFRARNCHLRQQGD